MNFWEYKNRAQYFRGCWIGEIKTDFAYSIKMKSLKLRKIDLDQYNR